MHRTLKAQTSRSSAASRSEQQIRFDHFRRHYNEERSHQALDQRSPAELYSASPRPMPSASRTSWYHADHQARRVRSNGEVMWKGELLFISEALIGELIGIAELETGDQVVCFCHFDIGLIYRLGQFRRFAPPRDGLRGAPELAPISEPSAIIPVQNVCHQPG